MTSYEFDVDVDFSDRDQILKTLKCVPALANGRKHNTGVYFQDIPCDPSTGVSNIDHKDAGGLGYFKMDFLNASVYDGIESESELDELINTVPPWELLLEEEFSSKLFHLGDYGWLLKRMQPASVEQLAMVLAVMRPAKRHLRDLGWNDIEKEVWVKPTDGEYYFKKAHAMSYAVAIVVQMNKIVKQLLTSS